MSRLRKNTAYFSHIKRTSAHVQKEIELGLALLNGIQRPLITVLGAHQVSKNNPYFQHCKRVAYELGMRGYAIASGGGPGIMQAANEGATNARTPSLGLKAALINNEHVRENIYTHQMAFKYVFVRRFILSIRSDALIFYPGGYGTLNELFEYAVLMQTGISDKVPLICVDKNYWKGMFQWFKQQPIRNKFFSEKDLKLFRLADSFEDIFRIIKG